MSRIHKFVCGRCGVAVVACGRPSDGSTYWKHANGGHGNRSCRRPPLVVSGEEYERVLHEALAGVRGGGAPP